MKHLVTFLSISFVASSPAYSQQWFTEWMSHIVTPDSMVTLLTVEFQKAVGRKEPTFAYRRLNDSTTHVLSEDSGNVVIVNLWATDCSGCRYEMPDLSRLQDVYQVRGLRIIFLSSESTEKLNKFFALHKITGVKGIIDRNQLERPYQLFAKPSSFIVDRSGIVRDTWIGPKVYEDLEKRIQLYLDRDK
jgi:peroxiredoxin